MLVHAPFGRHRRRHVLVLSVAVAALAAAGCSSDSGGGPAGPTPTANGDAVSAQATSLGSILVDGRGRTVYDGGLWTVVSPAGAPLRTTAGSGNSGPSY